MDSLKETIFTISTPIGPNHNLMRDGIEMVDEGSYHRLIGRLIYESHNSVLSQFMHFPNIHHIKGAYRVLKYLKGIMYLGLVFIKKIKIGRWKSL